MSTPRDTLAASVRAELARERMSGRKLARDLNLSHAYVARRLSGDVPFDADELIAIADVLGVPVARFYETPEVRERQPANGSAA